MKVEQMWSKVLSLKDLFGVATSSNTVLYNAARQKSKRRGDKRSDCFLVIIHLLFIFLQNKNGSEKKKDLHQGGHEDTNRDSLSTTEIDSIFRVSIHETILGI